jgi:hypothetical protein
VKKGFESIRDTASKGIRAAQQKAALLGSRAEVRSLKVMGDARSFVNRDHIATVVAGFTIGCTAGGIVGGVIGKHLSRRVATP